MPRKTRSFLGLSSDQITAENRPVVNHVFSRCYKFLKGVQFQKLPVFFHTSDRAQRILKTVFLYDHDDTLLLSRSRSSSFAASAAKKRAAGYNAAGSAANEG